MKSFKNNAELVEYLDKITIEFKGGIHELESAIGFLMIGRHFGWKPLILIHDKNTIKKYEAILKLNFKEELEPVGKYAEKANAYRAVLNVSSFWKAVKGEIPGIKTSQIE